jgi:hypothetical protein
MVSNPLTTEFANTNGPGSIPQYQYFAVGLQFSCEVTIPIHDTPFGSKTVPFRSQKLARDNAAKEAVQWLKENGHLTGDERPAKKRKLDHPTSTTPQISTEAGARDSPSSGASYGKQVSGKYHKTRISRLEEC